MPAAPHADSHATLAQTERVERRAAAIELTDVSFAYDQRLVLRGISMKIPRGKIVAIMGGSGCGKTTILRLIGGALKPRSGKVMVAGQSVPDLDADALYALRRRFGMLFQFGALFTDMSVFENIAFPMREHTDLSEELIRDLVLMKLHAVGLRGAASLMPAELSGGMARRVALARAIALDPIVVTHDVYESLKIVDYLYFVSEGKIVASGTADEVRASVDSYVRQFVDGEPDGPVPFHYPAQPYAKEL